VLAHHYRDRATLDFVASGGLDDFIRDASSGLHIIAFLAPNCFLPPQQDMLGYSIRAVHAFKAACSVPLAVLTPMEEWLPPLRSAGADLCLQTPFTAKELVRTTSRFIDLRP